MTGRINAGFGENLCPDDILSDYESWAHSRANQLLAPHVNAAGLDRDDLAQIGMSAMWKALDTYDPEKGALPAWLTLKATGAMKDALKPREKDLLTQPLVLDDSEGVYTPEALLLYPDMLLGIERAYHRGQVAQALALLTPRQQEYVHLRFWKGYKTSQLKAHFGYDPSGLWNSPKNGAKFKLRSALKHLVEV